MYIKENKKQYLDGEFMHSRFISSLGWALFTDPSLDLQ